MLQILLSEIFQANPLLFGSFFNFLPCPFHIFTHSLYGIASLKQDNQG